ncbi:uncharacterized protein LOC133842341 [Drosophila sulfurigaster albostrigata]|uniref:uncharacterized protein LOC133842341 n=1 Tax=Drosophila sulfurigaster albostrigata TaxID=89887 RepID=UPI002D219E65|nr:uncharacterized protein LOC133842341 [Drosophila sulfurigaster albostrigata]
MVKLLEKVCCMRLRTAGFVIGWLGVLGAVIGFLSSACVIASPDALLDHIRRYYDNVYNIRLNADTQASIRKDIVLISSIYLAADIIAGLISGLLIHGIKKNRYLMILPWLILNGIGLICSFLYLLVATYLVFQGTLETTIIFIASILFFVLYYYIYWGIYSLYKHIQIHKITGHTI